MIKINENLKKSVQEKYLNTIDMMDYEDRKKLTIENLENAEEIKNDNGHTYAVIATFEDNALLYNPSNKYHPYTVAKGLYPSLRSWINGSYHGTYEIAKEQFNKLK